MADDEAKIPIHYEIAEMFGIELPVGTKAEFQPAQVGFGSIRYVRIKDKTNIIFKLQDSA